MDPDEEPCPIDPRDGRAALTRPAQPCAGWMSPGALIRQTLLNVPPGPNTRRPTVDEKLLSQAIAQLGKVGSNLNQIAKHLNAGRPGDRVEGVIGDAMRDVYEWRTMLMQAIGEERYHKIKD
jgi:hypothetical protein